MQLLINIDEEDYYNLIEQSKKYTPDMFTKIQNDIINGTPLSETGKWIKVDTNMYSCSNCSHCFTIVPEDNNISQFKWCPHCHAKMEGESA